ncbi:MAG: DUF4395 family protein [bacterium]
MNETATARRRLEAQGFHDLDDATWAELSPWLRWSPAFCTIIMAVGTVLAAPAVLWSLAAIALAGAILPFHPFDLLYNYGFRYLTGTRAFPFHGPQRRFACGVASVWLLGTGYAFQEGAIMTGFVLGGVLTAVALLVSTTHFCIPSLIYNTVFAGRGVK